MPARKKIKVLIAEDKEVLRLGLRQIIKTIPDCEVVAETVDGPAAITQACKLVPHLVLIRDDLPLPDGIKTTQQLKRRLPGTRVIMLLTRSSNFLKATESGADGYILRETPEHLIAVAIDTVIHGGTWIGPLVAEYLLRGDGAPLLWRAASQNIELPNLKKLTVRERDVLRFLSRGLSNQKIATALGLKIETVKVHVRSILKKLEVKGRAEVVAKVLRQRTVV